MERDVKFKQWMIVAAHSKDVEGLELEKLGRPQKVGGCKVMDDLSEMTLGQMMELQDCEGAKDMFYRTCRVLLGMEKHDVDESLAVEVVAFTGWVAGRIIKINKLFNSVKLEPTDDQVRAGISKMNFGIFGIVDWYAKRMGITDHEKVFGVSWMRIYKCLEIDTRTEQFNRRLHKVMSRKNRPNK